MKKNKKRLFIIFIIIILLLIVCGILIYNHFKPDKKSISSEEKVEYIKNAIVIGFKDSVLDDRCLEIINEINGEIIYAPGNIYNLYTVLLDTSNNKISKLDSYCDYLKKEYEEIEIAITDQEFLYNNMIIGFADDVPDDRRLEIVKETQGIVLHVDDYFDDYIILLNKKYKEMSDLENYCDYIENKYEEVEIAMPDYRLDITLN